MVHFTNKFKNLSRHFYLNFFPSGLLDIRNYITLIYILIFISAVASEANKSCNITCKITVSQLADYSVTSHSNKHSRFQRYGETAETKKKQDPLRPKYKHSILVYAAV